MTICEFTLRLRSGAVTTLQANCDPDRHTSEFVRGFLQEELARRTGVKSHIVAFSLRKIIS
ncbi:MAG: hypothetical protein AAF526_09445 [Pseudomonadota bacterium]